MMPVTNKAFDLMGDDIVKLSTKNDALKIKIGFYDEKWLEQSKAKLLAQIGDEKRASLIISRMKKTDGKTLSKWLLYLIAKYGKPKSIILS